MIKFKKYLSEENPTAESFCVDCECRGPKRLVVVVEIIPNGVPVDTVVVEVGSFNPPDSLVDFLDQIDFDPVDLRGVVRVVEITSLIREPASTNGHVVDHFITFHFGKPKSQQRADEQEPVGLEHVLNN